MQHIISASASYLSNTMSYPTVPASACTPSAIPTPTLFGAQILNLSASPIHNFTQHVSDQLFHNHPSISVENASFCNVTVTYTHPGQNDTLNVEIWLPLNTWNGRLQSVGGGGWVAGRFPLSRSAMAGAIGGGYATSTTDGGTESAWGPEPWALKSEGNVDLFALHNLASVSLGDLAIISKDVIKSFYSRPPEYSYWSGCSQGGRQGFMLAQRYPNAYDGIAAAAPAFNWAQFVPSITWAQVMMNLTNQFPPKCEIDGLTAAAVAACDPLDGVTDGLISDYDACTFDPFTMVGKVVNCSSAGETAAISLAAASIANLSWTGPRKANGDFLWYGLNYQARLTSVDERYGPTADAGYASTICSANGTCVGHPIGLGEAWLKYFIKKDPKWDSSKIVSVDEYTRLFHASVQQYDSIVGTADPDLDEFRGKGGKIVTYHGLADTIIPVKGTSDYHNRVAHLTPNVKDFFRYFEVPGLAHCAGGVGGQPTATFQALVDWVEKGIAPESLPISFNDTAGTLYERILCPYPEKAKLISGDADVKKADSYICST